MVFQRYSISLLSYWQCRRVPVSLHPHQHLVSSVLVGCCFLGFFFFCFSHSNRSIVVYGCRFISWLFKTSDKKWFDNVPFSWFWPWANGWLQPTVGGRKWQWVSSEPQPEEWFSHGPTLWTPVYVPGKEKGTLCKNKKSNLTKIPPKTLGTLTYSFGIPLRERSLTGLPAPLLPSLLLGSCFISYANPMVQGEAVNHRSEPYHHMGEGMTQVLPIRHLLWEFQIRTKGKGSIFLWRQSHEMWSSKLLVTTCPTLWERSVWVGDNRANASREAEVRNGVGAFGGRQTPGSGHFRILSTSLNLPWLVNQ